MPRIVVGLAASLIATGLCAMQPARPPYPATKTGPESDTLHGQVVPDPYRWLEEGDNPAVKEWTGKQNAYTRSYLDALPGRDKIAARLEQLTQIGALGVPRPAKGTLFYSRRDGKQNQPVMYVRAPGGPERVLLDVNALAADGTTALDWHFPSHDGKLWAYGLSVGGSEMSTLRIRNVATGKDLSDTIERCRACSIAWKRDGKSFYYTKYPKPGEVPAGEEVYHRHVFYHVLGQDQAKDVKIFGEGRSKEDWPNVTLSPNGRWLVVNEQKGWAKSEVYISDETGPRNFKPLAENLPALFDVDATDKAIYVRTNLGAPRYKLYKVDPTKLDRKDWVEIVPEAADVLEHANVVGDTLVCTSMEKAASRLRLRDLDGKLVKEVELPTLGSVVGIGAEDDGKEFYYGFHSFTMPTRIYRFDLAARTSAMIDSVKADIDFDAYEVKQVEYLSKDKTPITMFLASKKGVPRDGKNPTILYGYGGFNISMMPSFSAARFTFLERGGVLAIANLRGGGEYGEAWHQAGMLGNKQNVFDDFIAAGEWLVKEKVSSPEHLAIQGGSNGGLLVGATMTQRPDLFKAVVCQVPLLDMVRYHKFLIAKLWIPEFGSSDSSEQFNWVAKYSPYHHVKDGTKYPATLITTAESDTRVDPLHARKMAARLQAANGANSPILVRIETMAGHGAGKPRGKQVEELTDTYSFLFEQLGVK